jgi:serine protease Do
MKMYSKKTIFITVLLALIMTLTLATSCITITSPEATTVPVTPTPAEPVEPIDEDWEPAVTPAVTPELPSIADVVAIVKPSVVAINTEVDVFTIFGSATEQGSGSGWILDEKGIIVTNNHVVEGAKSITVTLDDGRTFPVDLNSVYTDPLTDLAILKIDAEDISALTIGDSSKLRVGDWVIAIGNSLGRGTRATVGIVSQLGVSLQVDQGQSLYDLIDTSAVINPGNSGGPLVNLSGEVIGITSAKIVATGAEATGFAISSEGAKPIIKELVNKGYVVRPFLGVVNLLTVDQSVASYFRLGVDHGVLVRGTVNNSPAANAGLEAGDVIIRLGGEEVNNLQDLTQVLYASEIGEPLEVVFIRDSTENTVTVIPTETPRPSG